MPAPGRFRQRQALADGRGEDRLAQAFGQGVLAQPFRLAADLAVQVARHLGEVLAVGQAQQGGARHRAVGELHAPDLALRHLPGQRVLRVVERAQVRFLHGRRDPLLDIVVGQQALARRLQAALRLRLEVELAALGVQGEEALVHQLLQRGLEGRIVPLQRGAVGHGPARGGGAFHVALADRRAVHARDDRIARNGRGVRLARHDGDRARALASAQREGGRERGGGPESGDVAARVFHGASMPPFVDTAKTRS